MQTWQNKNKYGLIQGNQEEGRNPIIQALYVIFDFLTNCFLNDFNSKIGKELGTINTEMSFKTRLYNLYGCYHKSN